MSDEPPYQEPDDSEPTPERQAELRAAYQRNRGAKSFKDMVFHIRTRGELLWFMRDQGWSGEVDDQHAHRVALFAVNFASVNLRGIHLYMASLDDCYFAEADLSGAVLIGAHLVDTGFANANLKGAHLAGAYLPHSNLYRADLESANLRRADLSSAGLDEANLRNANLFGVDLCGTHLSGADLRGADLRDCRLDKETNFDYVRTDASTRPPRGVRLPLLPTEQQ